jgi:hypothetical protein
MIYTSKFVAAVIGLLVMAIVASRQLFLFTVFRDAQGLLDAQGGRYHLWLAVSASIAACTSGALMFYFFLRRQRITSSTVPQSPIGTLLTDSSGTQSSNLVRPTSLDAIHWPRLNLWPSEGQADDRTPMNGAVAERGGSASAQREFARRSHQIMFKKWSQARHH